MSETETKLDLVIQKLQNYVKLLEEKGAQKKAGSNILSGRLAVGATTASDCLQ